MGAMTPQTAILASGLFGGGSSLLSGMMSAGSARANNQQALDFQRWSQLEAQQFQQQMYSQQRNDQEDFFKKYQSPAAIAKALAQLGMNPANVMGGGSGISAAPASMPSGVSSPALGAPPLENEGLALSQSIQAIGSSMASIVQASQNAEQSEEAVQTFSARVDRLLLENYGKKVANNKAEFDLIAAKAKLPLEKQKLSSEAYINFVSGNYQEALKQFQDIVNYVKEHTSANDIEYSNKMLELVGKQIMDVTEAINLKKEEQKTQKSVRALNYSAATLNKAVAATENALRDGKVEMQNLANDLSTLDKFLKGNDVAVSDATLQARIFGLTEQLYREGLISENVYKEGQILSTKRDWAARQEFGQYLNNVVGAACNVANTYNNYRGTSLNRLSAKERNDIQRDFVNEYKRIQQQNQSTKRSAVLGPDWEMYSDQLYGR